MNHASYKALFQDVDGCLNPGDGEAFGADSTWSPSASQLEMLSTINREVEASPLQHYVINSGRFWPIMKVLASALPTPKLRYFVLEHGCVIYDREHEQNLDLMVLAQRYGLTSLVDRFGNLEVMQTLLAWYDETGQAAMEARYGVPMPRLDKAANLSFSMPEQAEGGEVLSEIESLIHRDFSEAEIADFEFLRSDQFVDILPGVHKFDGVELMLAHLNLQPSESIAMGDYLNDLSVFQNMKNVLCPSNAHPQIIEMTEARGAHGIVSKYAYGEALLGFLRGD